MIKRIQITIHLGKIDIVCNLNSMSLLYYPSFLQLPTNQIVRAPELQPGSSKLENQLNH